MKFFDNPSFKEIDAFLRDEVMENTISLRVSAIIDRVKRSGDKALIELTSELDSVDLSSCGFKVGQNELGDSLSKLNAELIESLIIAKTNIVRYHEHQKRPNWQFEIGYGSYIREVSIAVNKVGVYVPGGTAPLVSSVLMSVLPAKVAGVKEIYVVTPPQKNGMVNDGILAACAMCEVDAVYKIGGAQAIAALAYGTQSVPKVDIIVGPGNPYVTEAKRQVYGVVGLDMVAGPSEVLVLADENTNIEFAAMDLLSQIEHGTDSKGICVSTNKKVLEKLETEIVKQSTKLSRKEIINVSLKKGIILIKVDKISQMVDIVNHIGPEHLEIMLQEPKVVMDKITNAGVVFIGGYTPEAVGDYVAGPSHVLPTGGKSRFFYGLSIYHFLKKMSYISYTKEKLNSVAKHIINIAQCEGLDAHLKSVEIRTKEE